MTAQEIFDTVARHLVVQGKPAFSDYGPVQSCNYRAPDGSKCAIGCLITDEEYGEEFEGTSVLGVLSMHPGLDARLGPHVDLLVHLQDAHDWFLYDFSAPYTNYANFPAWENQMRVVAERFGLSAESMGRDNSNQI